MIAQLACPECRKKIERVGGVWRCDPCGRTFGYQDGILTFLRAEEAFNEGEFEENQKEAWSESARLRAVIRSNKLLSWLNDARIRFSLSGRRDRVFLRGLRGADKSAVVLDVGCGGGRHYLRRFGRVVGIDPVLPLMRQAREIYDEVYQGSGFALPFAEGSFDYVVSSDLIGHIREPEKDRFFSEIHRVLKQGGRTVHVIETDACNPWYRLAHRQPDLFQRYFVDKPGHVGLELPTQLRQRWLRHGFKEVSFRKMSSRVQEVGFISSGFGNEYRERIRGISILIALDRFLARSLVVRESLNLLLEPVAWLDDALSPLDYGSGMLAIFEK